MKVKSQLGTRTWNPHHGRQQKSDLLPRAEEINISNVARLSLIGSTLSDFKARYLPKIKIRGFFRKYVSANLGRGIRKSHLKSNPCYALGYVPSLVEQN